MSSTTSDIDASSAGATFRPYTGSCHCGAIRYVVQLALPPEPVESSAALRDSPPAQYLYRCNCTVCHKAGILHLRLRRAPSQFALLSPLDPLAELADYQCASRSVHWMFCRTCGVRCFAFAGPSEIVEGELELPTGSERRKYWRPADQNWSEIEPRPGRHDYLSVNAMTLEAGQEGVDLVRWTDEKRIAYDDELEANGRPKGGTRYGTPFPGGAY